MRHHRHRKASLIATLVMLVLSLWVVGGNPPPEAHADAPGGSGGDTPHCSSITTTTPGTYDCHNHGANYYITTTNYGASYTMSSGGVCYEFSHITRSCRRSSYSLAQCGSGPQLATALVLRQLEAPTRAIRHLRR